MADVENAARAALEAKIMQIVAREGAVDAASVGRQALLADLDIASADFIMILMAIEEEFSVYVPLDGPLSEAKTVGALIDGIVAHIHATQD